MIDRAVGPSERRALAAARVDASRASLVRALVAQDFRGARRASGADACVMGPSSPRGSRSLAVLALDAIDAASGKRPAAATLYLACAAAQGALAPLARRHPWALVGGAALAGATLAGAPPWRALLRPAVVGPVMLPWMGRLLSSLLLALAAAASPGA